MRDAKTSNRVTANDVAQAAGVSRSVVSRVYTKGASVSAKKRQLVMAAATKLGYEPNIAGRMLAGKASNVVGILVGPILNPFIAALLDKLTDGLRDAGYLPTLFKVDTTDADPLNILPLIGQYNMLSTIIVGVAPTEEIARQFFRTAPSPVILNLGLVRDIQAAVVTTDHFGGGLLAAQALLLGGAQRPALIIPEHGRAVYREREAGFWQCIDDAGLPRLRQTAADGSYADGHAATLALMQEKIVPDGVFYGNDLMALGGLDALRLELGLEVPEDVAVIGYDDIQNASLGSYKLSTIAQPVELLIQKALEAVEQLGNDSSPTTFETTLLAPTLVTRNTTKPALNASP